MTDGRVSSVYPALADLVCRTDGWMDVASFRVSDPDSRRVARSQATAVAAAGRRYGWVTRRSTVDGWMKVQIRAVTTDTGDET